MSILSTAADLNKLKDDLHAAKLDLGMRSVESENARTLLLLERVVGVIESMDERTRGHEAQLKRLQGDGK